MSISSDFWRELKKLKEEEEKLSGNTRSKSAKTQDSLSSEFWAEMNRIDDDIAPTVGTLDRPYMSLDSMSKEIDDRRSSGWFDTRVFDDGVDAKSIGKAILGTLTDVGENLTTGVLGSGEKALDALMGVGAAMNSAYQAQNSLAYQFDIKKYKEEQKQFDELAAKNLYDEEAISKQILTNNVRNWTGVDAERDSVLGEKSDSLVQSAGQMLLSRGLNAVGVPWQATTFLTSFGSEFENALLEGATHNEALGSSVVSAGAEVLSESLFGGSMIGEKGMINLDPITRGISNKLVKTLADWGVDMAAEGAEEVVSQLASNLGSSLYKEENLKEILFSEESFEEYLDSFIGGAVLGGIGNVGKAVKSGVKGTDYRSDFNLLEQKVVDKLYEQEASKKDKMTAREKTKLYESISEKMAKGYIDANDIESALGGESYKTFATEKDKFFGGETYKSWQENKAKTDELKTKIEELGKKTDATLMEQVQFQEMRNEFADRRAKQTEQKKALDAEAQRIMGLRDQMRSEVMEKVKDSRLAETYRELGRSKQKFQTDVSKYENEHARKTVESILKSGLGDNTNQFHDTVEWLASISEQKGVTFDLTKTERLKGTQHYREGYVTNGFKTKNGDLTNITLNLDGNYLNSTVGHEITHVLEEAGVYKDLQSVVRDFAIAKEGLEGYNKRMNAIKEIYGEDQTTIDSELTADIIGEYLFTDSDFVHSLSTQNRNVFQKVYDEIKYLWKVATAGSKEKRELERVKKMFDQAWRENVKGTTEESSDAETQYSIVKDQKTIDWLENQEYMTVYKAMSLHDGKLYPPMSSQEYVDEVYTTKSGETKTRRVRKLKNPSELGKWQQADERPDLIKNFKAPSKKYPDGYGTFDLLKSNGKTTGDVAYNPYEHTSNIVLNDQFAEAYQRPELVTVEYHIPKSELTSGYKAQYAKDPVGLTDWKTGIVATKLTKNKREVYLTRWSKPVRIVPDSEVAMKYKELLDQEEGISVPWNVVTPSLRTELEKLGVPIDYSDIKAGSTIKNFQTEMAKQSATEEEPVKTLEGGSVTKYSLSTWTPEMQKKVSENLVLAGFEKADVDKWIADTNGIAAVIASDKARLDFEAHENHTMVKDNNEYYKTVEASTLCAKRLKYQGTFDAIQHRLPNTTLTSDMLIELREMMKKNGHEVPCGACYVESRRRHLGKYATDWLKTYDGEYIPTLADVTTTNGLEKLRIEHPQTYNDFIAAMNKKGVSNPKVVELRTEYKGEIMKIPNSTYKKIMKIGGLRLQSFSDFETPHLLDMMQVVHDMASRKFVSQAYTKVPNFAWVLGDTNIKINLSLIPSGTGVDANGELTFDPKEGMDINEAMRLRDRYSKNVGTTIIGINDEHILKCMADDRIDYIIPFHRSGWGSTELKAMGLDSYIDYTKQQRERDIKTGKGVDNIDEMSYWDFSKTGKENAEAYLALCAEKGVIPKFDKFLVNNGDGSYSLQPDGSTDGYWKALINFKMYDNDGVGSPHQAVVPNFNMEEAHRVLNEYEGGANSLPVADDVVEEFVKKYQEDIAPVKSTTQYSMTKEEKAKMDEDYFAAIESGDEEVQNHLVREFAKASMPDSKLVDENGNLRVVYHGTNTGDFTVFNPDYIGMSSGDDGFFGMGFYFAYSKGEASYYGARRIIPAYLNLTNPFDFQKELHTYNGKRARYGHAPDAVALMNFADKFPDIAMHITMGAIKNGESSGKRISVFEFAKEFKNVIENKEFDYQEMLNDWGEKETLVTADPQVHEYEYDGEIRSWRDFGFQKRFSYGADILDIAYEYLSNAVYSYIDIPRFTSVILDNNREFTAELKNRGYDGTIQSEHGDEAVAFYPNQIKSAEAITRDADGNVIPLSKRFDDSQDDIRYSMTKAEVENAYEYDLENDDMLGAEMAVEQMANLMMPDSKIRDKNGRLIPVYHGTNADFWEFDTSADGGKNGTAEGFGIYLSDNQEVTNAYGDRQIKMFANITKPATSFKKTIKVPTLVKLIKQTCERQAQQMVDEEGYDSIKDAIRDTWVSNYVDTYSGSMDSAYREVAHSMIQQNDNDKDIIHEVMFGMAIRSYDQAMDFYNNSLIPVTGIDGFITKWENASTGSSSNIYLAFDSSQLKSADAVTYDESGNVIPLSERFNPDKKDIRYSISKEGENKDNINDTLWSPHHDEFEDFAPIREDISKTETTTEESSAVGDNIAPTEEEETPRPTTRKAYHASIIDRIKATFAERGFDFDEVLNKARNLSTFGTVDNTPQRVMEKSLGYKEGGVLADLTVNQVAQNESEGIKWLNSFTDRKNGLLAQISKQYHIKPGSKESAAAQMYAEGFYVNENNEIIRYGDPELIQDFGDPQVRANIKGLARDPRIRQIYDETLKAINESRARNLYPEIPRLDNYFLHFRAMEDTFSRLGLPFNPNDIRAKDLPTDLNGVTADLKPGQPYFASAMHRTGKRTSFDLLGGLEKYLTSAKNQIYHIDDIQTLRALRNYIADTYGQANGLENLDSLNEDEVQFRIEQVFNSHLSTFAKFLNEEANIIAGKTPLIDRGIEGMIGRRAITFLDTLNGQVGSNMVGYNISSALTNFLSVAQGFAKTNKADFVKAFAQTVSNKVSSIHGNGDGFAEASPVMIRRKGAERFYRTPWQKMADPGYALMGAVDDISTELIARTKYNEFIRKGMDAQQAHFETDKWVSRLMGDRSLGQMPQLFNSKTLGLITKFQLEVRNQLDSQFYDTIQEAKVSTEDIENAQRRNAVTAAKIGSSMFQMAVVQHLFGKAFESVAGYNPAFDIISVLMTAFGFDDEEEEPVLDNVEEAFMELMDDMPYSSILTGGRIPISSALPIEQFIKGEDQYGNEKSRWETLGEVAPYYLMPGGYGQIKKTVAGLGMFSDEHPISGSYTDSGNLRFPVEDTFGNRAKAAVFGQYASANARDYFDNNRSALKPNQIEEYMEFDAPIQDYWEYRDGLKGLDSVGEKADYINSLDLPISTKNMLINNQTDRKNPIDLTGYDKYDNFEEFDWATKNPEKYEKLMELGISYQDYASADEETKKDYNWAIGYPQYITLSKAVTDDVWEYREWYKDMVGFEADKNANGKSISGSKKAKVIDYIDSLDIEYGAKLVLLKSQYKTEDRYNAEIFEYIKDKNDLTFEEKLSILKTLGFGVSDDGKVTWD